MRVYDCISTLDHCCIFCLAQPSGTWVRLVVQNFTPIGVKGWNMAPKMAKNFVFGRGKPLTDFYNC